MGDRTRSAAGSQGRDHAAEVVTLQPLVAWLEEDPDGIARRIEQSILDELPILVDDDTRVRSSLQAAIASHLPVIASVIRDGTDVQKITIPSDADRFTREVVHRNVSLIDLLRSYEVGHAALWTAFATTLRSGSTRLPAGRRADVLELASLRIFDYLQAATAWAVTTYTGERARLERRAASRRAEAVAAVLAGGLDATGADGDLGGYPLNERHVGYVAWVRRQVDAEVLERFVTGLPGRVGARHHLHVVAPGGELIGWLTVRGGPVEAELPEIDVPEGIGFAFGDVHGGVDGFRSTHDEALEARRVVDLFGLAGPTAYESIVVAALASRDLPRARALVERELKPVLVADTSGRLIATLRVYLEENASPTRAARRLDVHPNTVVKRIERVETLLGRRVDAARLQLRVALELVALSTTIQQPTGGSGTSQAGVISP